MSTLDDWLVEACTALGLKEAVDTALLLDLAREVAHAVARPAAPLTTYLLGLAVAGGADPGEAAETLTHLAREWPPA
ncbi:MAG: hypothetical protein JWM02_2966 [Frankiales bacterium]|nr:hypothetical protein [Frankiales bacterium]